MNIIRTDKDFTQDNLSHEFIVEAFCLGGLHSSPKKFTPENYLIEEVYYGVCSTGSKTPWEDGDEKNGYERQLKCVRLNNNYGFDTDIVIFNSGKIQGYFKESHNQQFAADPVAWTNLLLKHGFLKIVE